MANMINQGDFSDCASWLEISESALKNNIEVFRSLLKQRSKLGVVLKGGAYGHGIEPVFRIIQPWVDYVYVITAQDAFRLRQIEVSARLDPVRILVMGALSVDEMINCAKQNIEIVIGTQFPKETILQLRARNTKLLTHIHLDTGLSREGFGIDSLDSELEFINELEDLIEIKGIMSHFANTEDVTEQQYAEFQVENFKLGIEKLEKIIGLKSKVERHIAASAATLVIPSAQFDLVRVGISLYGFWPSTETRISTKIALGEVPRFKPVLAWKCKSQLIKPLKKGSYIGYGCTYRAEKDLMIAVLPVGYYDGYPRNVSGKAHVLINGKRCPVLGRVMMNHIIVDVTHVTASIDQPLVATLIGEDGNEVVSAETVANWAQTIHYELISRLGPHLKRNLVE